MIKRKITASCASLAVCALIVLILCLPDTAAQAARDALAFSAESVVPALFAFSVLSNILSSVGLPRSVIRIFPLHRLLGLPESAAPAVLCGLVCGFPVGAMMTCSLYKDRRLTRAEAARLCAVSANVSGAFLVVAVGKMFSSHLFGAILWAAQTAVSLGAGIVMNLAHGEKERRTEAESPTDMLLSAVFCQSVARSSSACLTVTGYIAFFRVIGAVLASMLPPLCGPLALVLEFSSGAAYSAKIGSSAACGFSVGLGGVSALMQVCNYAGEDGVSLFPTVCVKAVSAGVLALVGLLCEGMTAAAAAEAFAPVSAQTADPLVTIAAVSAVWLISRFLAKKYFSRGT